MKFHSCHDFFFNNFLFSIIDVGPIVGENRANLYGFRTVWRMHVHTTVVSQQEFERKFATISMLKRHTHTYSHTCIYILCIHRYYLLKWKKYTQNILTIWFAWPLLSAKHIDRQTRESGRSEVPKSRNILRWRRDTMRPYSNGNRECTKRKLFFASFDEGIVKCLILRMKYLNNTPHMWKITYLYAMYI